MRRIVRLKHKGALLHPAIQSSESLAASRNPRARSIRLNSGVIEFVSPLEQQSSSFGTHPHAIVVQ
jgi:hypothetical protein